MPIDVRTKLDLVRSDPNFARTLTNAPEAEDEHLYKRLGQDYARYLEMRRDPHVRSVLNKRRQSILGRRILVESATKKLRDIGVKAAEEILTLLNYESICSALLNSGQLIGYSVLQLDWEDQDGFILPKTKFIPQNRFMFAYPELDNLDIPTATGESLDPETEIIMVGGYELRLLTKDNSIYGERCPRGRFLVYTFDADNTPWGLGLGYSVFPWWSIKREAMKSWLLHSDRFGSPPTIGTHPADISDDDPEMQGIIQRFERFLKSVSPNGWARLPEDFKLTLPEGASADPSVHERLIGTSDAQVSKAVLGEMQYSDKSSGSYAANVSQVEDRDANLTDADCNILDEQMK
ncbi:MAG: DUF935 domain-containing protein, partial [Leptolyngbya sp. Prado105]|nr:DUF935 domain-containing protein [Leptolyngbya sp. Prado105]